MKKQRGIRLPSNIARKLTLDGPLTIQKPSEGLLLHSSKLSWEETARQMAESEEEWSCVEATVADGLDDSH